MLRKLESRRTSRQFVLATTNLIKQSNRLFKQQIPAGEAATSNYFLDEPLAI